MASSKHLHPLTTSHHNRSLSNISATSDACTFHSAQDHPQSSHMEMRPLSSSQTASSQTPSSPTKSTPVSSQKLDAIKMSRQDSGYQESSPRTSTSSRHSSHASSRPSKPKRRSTTESKSSSSRPNAKRASRSSMNAAQIRTSTSGSRPSLSSRHTSPFPHTDIQNIHQPYKFFQFPAPVLAADPTPPPDPPQSPHPPPPPATTQYWTSDQTRRLEYAAIDAAGKGVRGFFIRLVPDCILPPTSRRTRFCEQGGEDGASDAGSVRRYRLCLPEEKEGGEVGVKERRQGLWRRVTGRGR
ncbi:uncharacterized protein K444DRAFT_643127 [Hyaloscypha bicolor E]|uniref:Uncharacterized protein n=1 Tax=Hyaloscypha bicolor E TaxID=1095630 RepID=A0A2J6TAS1_9HELO|nr:uncharacterized protein K444DRAFT_643127 [Hyaloscypha bicolor E]PMD60127.1 hypothetical protein K444DRAFT_643127 [Hyaloscypha bicolor E]